MGNIRLVVTLSARTLPEQTIATVHSGFFQSNPHIRLHSAILIQS